MRRTVTTGHLSVTPHIFRPPAQAMTYFRGRFPDAVPPNIEDDFNEVYFLCKARDDITKARQNRPQPELGRRSSLVRDDSFEADLPRVFLDRERGRAGSTLSDDSDNEEPVLSRRGSLAESYLSRLSRGSSNGGFGNGSSAEIQSSAGAFLAKSSGDPSHEDAALSSVGSSSSVASNPLVRFVGSVVDVPAVFPNPTE